MQIIINSSRFRVLEYVHNFSTWLGPAYIISGSTTVCIILILILKDFIDKNITNVEIFLLFRYIFKYFKHHHHY